MQALSFVLVHYLHNDGQKINKYYMKGLSTDFVGGAQVDQSVSRRVLEGQVPLVLITPVFITPESLIHNMAYREMLLSKR